MIREYALDPDVICSDLNTLQRFFSEFGAENGRVLGAVPHKWKDDLTRKLQGFGLKDIAKRRCLENIKKIHETSLIARDGKSLGSNSWIEKAISLNGEEAFSGILTGEYDDKSNQFNYLNLLEHQPSEWIIENTVSVQRNAISLANSVGTSLRFASKPVHFVDPYFNSNEARYTAPLIEFLKKIQSGRSGVKKIFIHTCLQVGGASPKTRSELEVGLKSAIKPFLPAGFEVSLWVWPNDDEHDRFVITKHVGYSFGHGLNEREYQGAANVYVNRLGYTETKKLRTKYSTEAKRVGEPIDVIGGV